MRRNLLVLTVVLASAMAATGQEVKRDPTPKPAEPVTQAPAAGGALGFKLTDIDGKEVDLASYKGDVVMLVNVASRCGLTPQYEQLQALHEKYAGKGLRIVGVPANNFGGQEPGDNAAIKEFCTHKYKVGFAMMSKVSVQGEDKCPLYQFLTAKETNPKFAGEIKWNFTKFLIGRDGTVIARFEPRTKPDSDEVVKAIEAALAQPKP
ncbi:MAG: hypothetical protein CHACPFDD_03211 [Phycisphaerae bacterium]|nr:hypothetical protein [Phycisphaerae bacterium]